LLLVNVQCVVMSDAHTPGRGRW